MVQIANFMPIINNLSKLECRDYVDTLNIDTPNSASM